MSKEPRLKDKVCLISGASRGFGQAIAVRFVEEGARVALLSRTSCDETMKLIASIEGVDKVEDRAAWIPCDIGTEEDCKKAIEGCVAKFGDVIHGERRALDGGGGDRAGAERASLAGVAGMRCPPPNACARLPACSARQQRCAVCLPLRGARDR